MHGIKLIWESLTRAVIRYLESKSLRDDSVGYLRMEIEKLRAENRELLNHLLMPKTTPAEIDDEPVDWQPISKHQPWSSKQRQLEEASRQRAMNLAAEARVNLQKSKTTEQLESELLTGTD